VLGVSNLAWVCWRHPWGVSTTCVGVSNTLGVFVTSLGVSNTYRSRQASFVVFILLILAAMIGLFLLDDYYKKRSRPGRKRERE